MNHRDPGFTLAYLEILVIIVVNTLVLFLAILGEA